MQMHEAIQIRRAWVDKGNPPCEHTHVEKEYHLGSDTGDKVCTTCGQSFFNGKPV